VSVDVIRFFYAVTGRFLLCTLSYDKRSTRNVLIVIPIVRERSGDRHYHFTTI